MSQYSRNRINISSPLTTVISLQEETYSSDSVHAPHNSSVQAQKLKLCDLR